MSLLQRKKGTETRQRRRCCRRDKRIEEGGTRRTKKQVQSRVVDCFFRLLHTPLSLAVSPSRPPNFDLCGTPFRGAMQQCATHRETTVLEARREAPSPLGAATVAAAATAGDDARDANLAAWAIGATAGLEAARRADGAAGAQRTLTRRQACIIAGEKRGRGGSRRRGRLEEETRKSE